MAGCQLFISVFAFPCFKTRRGHRLVLVDRLCPAVYLRRVCCVLRCHRLHSFDFGQRQANCRFKNYLECFKFDALISVQSVALREAGTEE